MRRLIPDHFWGALTIYGEARGESQLGRVAVGEVIRTRMARGLFSDGSVCGTVLRAKQFSCWNDGDPNRITLAKVDADDPVFQASLAAWDESERTITTRGATHYFSTSLATPPSWAAHPLDPTKLDETKVTLRVGRHIFLLL